MTTFTNDQIALQSHIEAENARWVAECEERGATAWSTMVSNPEHWEGYGITTIEGYERHCLVSSIWDGYKEANGIRPRWLDMDSMSMDELRDMEARIYDGMREDNEREEREAEAEITAMIANGAGDRETAERWLRQVH